MGGPVRFREVCYVLVAFVVLIAARFVSLVLGSTKPEAGRRNKRKMMPMAHVEKVISVAAETAWALGTGTLAGLPLLT